MLTMGGWRVAQAALHDTRVAGADEDILHPAAIALSAAASP
jgi:hypothetical protein